MWTSFLFFGFLNVYAQHHNYGINISDTTMDIRVRRDVQETGHTDIPSYNIDREKREVRDQSKANISNNEWRNNYVWSKIKNQKMQRNNKTRNNPLTGDKNNIQRYTPQHTIMPRFNMTGFKSGTLYPGSHYNSTAYNSQNVKSDSTTGSAVTKTVLSGNGIPTPRSDITPVTPGHGKTGGKGSKTKIRACLLCQIPCPAGRHRDESGLYCIPDDMEY